MLSASIAIMRIDSNVSMADIVCNSIRWLSSSLQLEECQSLITEAVDILGGTLDILVNNAGTSNKHDCPGSCCFTSMHGRFIPIRMHLQCYAV